MKDVMDFEGDKEKGVKSFPKYIGIRKSNLIAALFYIIAIALSFLPFMISKYGIYYLNYYYFMPVLLTDMMLLTTSLQLIFKKNPPMALYRKMTLVAIFIGLVAFLLGALIQS